MGWTPRTLGSLEGKTFVITGGNSGIGLEASKILCSKGARVVVTTRTDEKGDRAIQAVRDTVADADVDYVLLDLADKESTLAAADAIARKAERIYALVNNAGVMQPPLRRTSEGFELQFGTNHLGHFRLTAALFPLLRKSSATVVQVSSIAHHQGRIDFDDPNSHERYSPTTRYCQSKLANLLFSLELHRRIESAGLSMKSIPVHPGYAATNLQQAGVGMEGGNRLFRLLYRFTNTVLAQSPELGSYPLVLAAADPEAQSGMYYGPTRFGDSRGPVGRCALAAHARNRADAGRLWSLSESLVGPFSVC